MLPENTEHLLFERESTGAFHFFSDEFMVGGYGITVYRAWQDYLHNIRALITEIEAEIATPAPLDADVISADHASAENELWCLKKHLQNVTCDGKYEKEAV